MIALKCISLHEVESQLNTGPGKWSKRRRHQKGEWKIRLMSCLSMGRWRLMTLMKTSIWEPGEKLSKCQTSYLWLIDVRDPQKIKTITDEINKLRGKVQDQVSQDVESSQPPKEEKQKKNSKKNEKKEKKERKEKKEKKRKRNENVEEEQPPTKKAKLPAGIIIEQGIIWHLIANSRCRGVTWKTTTSSTELLWNQPNSSRPERLGRVLEGRDGKPRPCRSCVGRHA